MGGLVCEDNGHPLKTNKSIMAKSKYKTEEERKAANRERANLRYQRLKDNEEFKAAQRAANAEYRSTQKGRANELLKSYRREDRKYNRGECTLSVEFILEHIFTQPCTHCGCSDWKKIGCNRLDNNLPHTPDNVEPCCYRCNVRLYGEDISKQVFQHTKDGKLIKVWPSVSECGKNGYNQGRVSDCCNGKQKTHKGYKWSYEPLQKQVCQLELKFE